MKQILFHSTNNKNKKVTFKTGLLEGLASDYGLYMIDRKDVPKLSEKQIEGMKSKSYADISFDVLYPYLGSEIPGNKLKELLDDAYDEKVIPTKIQPVTGKSHIMWLSNGPTYSFKDYAARFFGRTLNYFLIVDKKRRIVFVATSGDTGGAVADALFGLDNVDVVIFYPKDSISDEQRRQMTTLKGNVYAIPVNGDFDVCQELSKKLLGDKEFAYKLFKDRERFTSANSISLGRLLPQSVYPFYAYSRVSENGEPFIASVPSGNFGDMMGTILAKEMGLPVGKILCGVNENNEFPIFLDTGKYIIKPTKVSPSYAMNVSDASNLRRLFDFYGGHLFDERDANGNVIKAGVIRKMPDLQQMIMDIFSMSVSNEQHYETMKKVFDDYGIIIENHGAVAWKTLDTFLEGNHDKLAVAYETANPGKFPEDIKKAIKRYPNTPKGIKKQATLEERTYELKSNPDIINGSKRLSQAQYKEAKEMLSQIYS